MIIEKYILTTATAQRIISRSANPQKVAIHNHEEQNKHDVFIGNENVSATTGFHIPHTETLQLIVNPNEELWAIALGGDCDVRILRQVF
jgi:hypothetical protein